MVEYWDRVKHNSDLDEKYGLCHARQIGSWGCMWHTAYALTWNSNLLFDDCIHESNATIWALKMTESGLFPRSISCLNLGLEKVPLGSLRNYMQRVKDGNLGLSSLDVHRYYLDVCHSDDDHYGHRIAFSYHGGEKKICVSDSLFDTFQYFTVDEFIDHYDHRTLEFGDVVVTGSHRHPSRPASEYFKNLKFERD